MPQSERDDEKTIALQFDKGTRSLAESFGNLALTGPQEKVLNGILKVWEKFSHNHPEAKLKFQMDQDGNINNPAAKTSNPSQLATGFMNQLLQANAMQNFENAFLNPQNASMLGNQMNQMNQQFKGPGAALINNILHPTPKPK